MSLLSIFAIPLAVWRISNMLADTNQTGLFNSLDWIRAKVGVKYDYYSQPTFKSGSIAAGILCVWCNSIWVGFIFTILYVVNQKVTTIISLPFALSAVAIFIEERIQNANKT